MQIEETCKCGAHFVVQTNLSNNSVWCEYRYREFLEAHKVCREKATSDRTASRLNWQLKHQFEELLKHYNKRLQSSDLSPDARKDYMECVETLEEILSRADA